MKRKVYKNEKGVTWSSSHTFKEFWGSLSAVHCKIFPENVRITPFPSNLIIPISHSSGVCPSSLSSRLPNGAPYWCVHIPSASYPYKALFLSSCPCSRILYEAPSIVVLVHQLRILTKHSSWVPVHLVPQPCGIVFSPEVVHGHPWCHPDSSCFRVTK